MEHKEYRLAAILYTDIVGFSRMMEKDETGTIKLMEYHNTLVRNHVSAHHGNIIKTIGDAFLIEFSNATNAVKCAIQVQKELEQFNAGKPAVPLVLRIGCHLGDIYFFENDALGEGINIASRLQSLCRPGRICMSSEVNNLVASKIEMPIRPLGVVTLKNITREINAYEVLTNGAAEELQENEVLSPKEAGTPDSRAFVPPGSQSEAPDYNEIRRLVFARIKDAGRRLTIAEIKPGLPWSGPEVDAYLGRLASQGFILKNQEKGPAFDPSYDPSYHDEHPARGHHRIHKDLGHEIGSEIKNVVQSVASEIRIEIEKSRGRKKNLSPGEYLERQEKNYLEDKKSFAGHLTSFLGVNGMLWFIWFVTMPFGFPWPLIVNASWGIGLFTHWASKTLKRKEVLQQQNLPPVTDEQFGIVKSLFRHRRSWWGQLTSTLGVSVALLIINLVTTGFSPLWAIFPVGAMAIALFARMPGYKSREIELLGQLREKGIDPDIFSFKAKLSEISAPRSGRNLGPLETEAERLRDHIRLQMKNFKGSHPLGDDFEPVLDSYVHQIRELSVRSREIDGILATIPLSDLHRELEATRNRMTQSDNPRMVTEYEKAIEQISKQITSHGEMSQEQQVLKQRLSNSVNALRQLDIDIGRMRSMSNASNAAQLDSLRSRSDELRAYLDDLQTGYREADKAPD